MEKMQDFRSTMMQTTRNPHFSSISHVDRENGVRKTSLNSGEIDSIKSSMDYFQKQQGDNFAVTCDNADGDPFKRITYSRNELKDGTIKFQQQISLIKEKQNNPHSLLLDVVTKSFVTNSAGQVLGSTFAHVIGDLV